MDALAHGLLGLIQVVRSYLLGRAQRGVGDASRHLALVLLPLVEDELLDAAEERLLVEGLRMVLVRLGGFICEFSRFRLVAVNTAIRASLGVQLLSRGLVLLVLVPHFDSHRAAARTRMRLALG